MEPREFIAFVFLVWLRLTTAADTDYYEVYSGEVRNPDFFGTKNKEQTNRTKEPDGTNITAHLGTTVSQYQEQSTTMEQQRQRRNLNQSQLLNISHQRNDKTSHMNLLNLEISTTTSKYKKLEGNKGGRTEMSPKTIEESGASLQKPNSSIPLSPTSDTYGVVSTTTENTNTIINVEQSILAQPLSKTPDEYDGISTTSENINTMTNLQQSDFSLPLSQTSREYDGVSTTTGKTNTTTNFEQSIVAHPLSKTSDEYDGVSTTTEKTSTTTNLQQPNSSFPLSQTSAKYDSVSTTTEKTNTTTSFEQSIVAYPLSKTSDEYDGVSTTTEKTSTTTNLQKSNSSLPLSQTSDEYDGVSTTTEKTNTTTNFQRSNSSLPLSQTSAKYDGNSTTKERTNTTTNLQQPNSSLPLSQTSTKYDSVSTTTEKTNITTSFEQSIVAHPLSKTSDEYDGVSTTSLKTNTTTDHEQSNPFINRLESSTVIGNGARHAIDSVNGSDTSLEMFDGSDRTNLLALKGTSPSSEVQDEARRVKVHEFSSERVGESDGILTIKIPGESGNASPNFTGMIDSEISTDRYNFTTEDFQNLSSLDELSTTNDLNLPTIAEDVQVLSTNISSDMDIVSLITFDEQKSGDFTLGKNNKTTYETEYNASFHVSSDYGNSFSFAEDNNKNSIVQTAEIMNINGSNSGTLHDHFPVATTKHVSNLIERSSYLSKLNRTMNTTSSRLQSTSVSMLDSQNNSKNNVVFNATVKNYLYKCNCSKYINQLILPPLNVIKEDNFTLKVEKTTTESIKSEHSMMNTDRGNLNRTSYTKTQKTGNITSTILNSFSQKSKLRNSFQNSLENLATFGQSTQKLPLEHRENHSSNRNVPKSHGGNLSDNNLPIYHPNFPHNRPLISNGRAVISKDSQTSFPLGKENLQIIITKPVGQHMHTNTVNESRTVHSNSGNITSLDMSTIIHNNSSLFNQTTSITKTSFMSKISSFFNKEITMKVQSIIGFIGALGWGSFIFSSI